MLVDSRPAMPESSAAEGGADASCEATTTAPDIRGFLPQLTQLVAAAGLQGDAIRTADFVACCEHILPIFEMMGTVFYVAKYDFNSKLSSLTGVLDSQPTLAEIVAADKAAGTVAAKNSCSRNLHRLTSVFDFVRVLLESMLASDDASLHDAATAAYDEVLAPIHSFMIRGAVRAGILLLPTRADFLSLLGETEESARLTAAAYIDAARTIVSSVTALYDGPMPASDTWWWPSLPGTA